MRISKHRRGFDCKEFDLDARKFVWKELFEMAPLFRGENVGKVSHFQQCRIFPLNFLYFDCPSSKNLINRIS